MTCWRKRSKKNPTDFPLVSKVPRILLRGPISTPLLVIFAGLWLAGIGNVALWKKLWSYPELHGTTGALFFLGFFVFVAALHIAFLSLLAWRVTIKPVIAFCLVAAALGANFMLTYGVVIDRTMMINVLQTDVRESAELLSLQLIIMLFVIALIPIGWLWRLELKPAKVGRQVKQNLAMLVMAIAIGFLAVMLTFQSMASVMRNHKQVRFMVNPLNSIYALGEVALEPFAKPGKPFVEIGLDAKAGEAWARSQRPPLMVIVVGETARAANFSLNGYGRNTNPELAMENVTSFTNVYSCGTSTAASVPCMFSHLGREAFDKRDAEYSTLLHVLDHAGLSVLWLDNNAGCKGTCTHIANVDLSNERDPEFCNRNECFDEVLLRGLDQRIATAVATKGKKGVVLVLHQKGSHGPAYYLRSPKAFKKFMPECETNALQSCSREQLINAYDNTILYTDHFLARTIDWLKKQGEQYDTAMLYVSDHGESLGEGNTYLHGLPYMLAPDVQKHVPMVVWLSPQMAQRSGVKTECLAQMRDKPLSHDHLFHSTLGLLNIQTQAYKAEWDMFRPCSSVSGS